MNDYAGTAERRRRATRPGVERCIVHPDAPGYRDPANTDIWRCIACEETGLAEKLLDWRDFHARSEQSGDVHRTIARLSMRRNHEKKKLARIARAC